MTNTLLCLVSDQRMQNIIPILQRGATFDHVAFLVSGTRDATGAMHANPRFVQIARATTDALRELSPTIGRDISTRIFDQEPLDEIDIGQAYETCKSAIGQLQALGPVTVNFTGGTKPMSIGAYQAAQELEADMVYVHTADKALVEHTVSGQASRAFNLLPISVKACLLAQGRVIDENQTQAGGLAAAELAVGEWLVDHRANRRFSSLNQALQLHHVLEVIHRRSVEQDGSVMVGEGVPQEIQNCLVRAGLAELRASMLHISARAAQLFKGTWLELYAYCALKRHPRIMDVRFQTMLTQPSNELDVAAVVDAQLRIVECKAGARADKDSEFLTKLEALRELCGGSFGRGYLVLGRNAHNVDQLIARAKAYGITVIDWTRITNLENIVAA